MICLHLVITVGGEKAFYSKIAVIKKKKEKNIAVSSKGYAS